MLYFLKRRKIFKVKLLNDKNTRKSSTRNSNLADSVELLLILVSLFCVNNYCIFKSFTYFRKRSKTTSFLCTLRISTQMMSFSFGKNRCWQLSKLLDTRKQRPWSLPYDVIKFCQVGVLF